MRANSSGRVVAIVLSLLTLCAAASTAATIHIPGDQPTIQAGIDAAGQGDTVLVACGTYTWASEGTGTSSGLIRMKSGVVLRGEAGQADGVTIDAQGQGRVIHCLGVDSTAVIEGLTITGGRVWLEPYASGAGILCSGSSPSIVNCEIVGNTCGGGTYSRGAGIYCESSHPRILNCVIADNTLDGGRYYALGAGIFFFASSCEMSDCTIRNNSAHGDAFCQGVGLFCSGPGPFSLSNCVISSNTGTGLGNGQGGGLFGYSDVRLVGCTVAGNVLETTSFEYGAGLYLRSHAEVTDCLIVGNVVAGSGIRWGGGVFCDGTITISECTIAGNAASVGGGILADNQNVIVDRTIVAGSVEGEAVACRHGGSATLTCSDVYENHGGDWIGCIAGQSGLNGNFEADPLFCRGSAGDYSLAAGSPCLSVSGCGIVGAMGQGCDFVSAVPDPAEEAPSGFVLTVGGANPVRLPALIRYSVPRETALDVSVYDTAGRYLATLDDGLREAGTFNASWDGRDASGRSVAAGVYFVRMKTPILSTTRKLVLSR